MTMLCQAFDPDLGLVRTLLGTVDCNVASLSQEGYGLLSRPGSPVMMLMTTLMTLYVGFIGYQLLLGRSPLRVGDLSVSALKIGLVIALGANWAVYQTLVYDTLFKAPEQVGSLLLSAVQPAGSLFAGSPIDGLQLAYDELTKSAGVFAGRAGSQVSPFLGGVGFGAFALNSSAVLLLLSTLGVMLASKIVLAILLALAPLVAGLLLFDATRGVAEGWLKTAVGFAVAPLLTTLFLALELTMLEPTLVQLQAMRTGGRADLAPTTQVFVLVLVFTLVAAGALAAAGAVAAGLRLPRKASAVPQQDQATVLPAAAIQPAALGRAAVIGAAVAARDRRETPAVHSGAASSLHERRINVGGERSPAIAASSRSESVSAPLGQTFRQRSAPPRSATASRRDR